jgi:hypothetical protein
MHARSAIIVLGLLMTFPVPPGQAEDAEPQSNNQSTQVEGLGFGAYDTESIKGFDENKVTKDPVCDRSKRPRITKVEPDEAKPGEKVVIKGENFGTKECMHEVTFSAAPGTKINYTYVNDGTLEALVPDAKAGMSFVVVVAGGGSAQSKPVLIKGK